MGDWQKLLLLCIEHTHTPLRILFSFNFLFSRNHFTNGICTHYNSVNSNHAHESGSHRDFNLEKKGIKNDVFGTVYRNSI